jgi:type VI protein secretion system component Hcp
MAIYMKFDGIPGDITTDEHKEWIACDSMHFSSMRNVQTVMGQGDQRQGGSLEVSEVTITKPMEKASPNLFLATMQAAIGKGSKVEIHLTRTDELPYMEFVLENCFVTSYNMDSDGMSPKETLSLNFLNIQMSFNPVKKDNAKGEPIRHSYNVGTGKAS